MPSCSHCTRTLPDGVAQCPFCGKKISAHADVIAEDHLFRLRNFLILEKKRWKINGLLCITVAFFLLLRCFFAFLSGDQTLTIILSALLMASTFWSFMNLRQFNLLQDLIEEVYLDCYPVLERGERKGPLVYAAFFNWFAFAILRKNRRYIFEHRKVLYDVRKHQDERLQLTFKTDLLHEW